MIKYENVSNFSPSSVSDYSSDIDSNSDESEREVNLNDKKSISVSSIQIEPSESSKEKKCLECNQTFPCDLSVYQNRLIENLSENLLEKKLLCCNFCCSTFLNLPSFKSHLLNRHKCQNLPEKIYTTLKKCGKFLCKFCNFFSSFK